MLVLSQLKHINGYIVYSKNSMTRTPMARLLWLNRTPFLSPEEILPITQENRSLGIFLGIISYFIMKMYVVFTH